VDHLIRYLVTAVHRTHHAVIGYGRCARLTVQHCVTGLHTVAELTIIAQAVVRGVDDLVGDLVAAVNRAGHPVIRSRWRPGLTVQNRVTYLRTITEQTVIAEGIGWGVDNLISDLVAAVNRAGHAVIHNRRRTGLTARYEITDLGTVTEERVIADRVVRCVDDLISHLVTAVYGAGNTVCQDRWGAGLTAQSHIADLRAIAESGIVTDCVVGCVENLVRHLITAVHSAGNAVIHCGRCSRLAVQERIADLCAITEGAIRAEHIRGCVDNLIANLIAAVDRAGNSVIDQGRCTWLTIQHRITDLCTVTEQSIIAEGIAWSMDDLPGHVVTGIDGTGHPIVERRWCIDLTVQDRVAGLGSVTEEAIVADAVIGNVQHQVSDLVTAIRRTRYTVIQGRRGTRLAVEDWIAELGAVTEGAVITARVVGGVQDLIPHLVTAVNGAQDAVIHDGCGPTLAVQHHIAELRSVTEQTVITQGVGRRIDDLVPHLITAVNRARHAIISRWCGSCLTVQREITELRPVTEQTIITEAVVRGIDHLVPHLVATVDGARHTIVDHRRRPRLTARQRIADLCTVTEESVITHGVVRGVHDLITHLVTAINSACDPVIDHGGCPCLAAQQGVTHLCPVAEQAVVTGTVIRNVQDLVPHLVTAVQRTGNTIVHNGRRSHLAAQNRITGLGTITEHTVVAGCVIGRV
jgi:hypothetical protein